MTARLERGEFQPAPEELEIEMFHHAAARLAAAGFERYEVSNYARPGHACRHNLAYWRQEPWLACGPSASAHVAGHRWKNAPHLDTWLSHHDQGFAPITDHESPDPARALREKIMTGLRLAEGLDLPAILQSAHTHRPHHADALLAQIQRAQNEGTVNTNDGRLRLTERGIIFADGIAARFMLALL
jgi:oxygen-independent coproporphyrinogen-3 oxidase